MTEATNNAGSFQREEAAFDRARKEKACFPPVLNHTLPWLEVLDLGSKREQKEINGRMRRADDYRRTFFQPR